ncbi:MAG: hypothetical protein VKJ86_10000 [Synechococcus sp.]|nr:hypothetical protein [Synechococcus sp.]
MKALILALGISSLAVPAVAQGSCLEISNFYTTCSDGRGNQYSIQTFGPNTFINGTSYYSRSPYYPNRRGDRHWGQSSYRNTNSTHHYSFSNTFKGQTNKPWQYEPYWQQPWKNNTYTPPQFNTYWQRNPWQRPSYHDQPNIYLYGR